MPEFTLTVLDTSGIQGYVFNSNNLQHITGASGLVNFYSYDKVFQLLIQAGRTNVDKWGQINNLTIEKEQLDSELIYAGGGNTVILFSEHSKALEFARNITRSALQEAPGLNLVLAHTQFEWLDAQKPLRDVVQQTMDEIGKRKRDRKFSTPLLGLGVTHDCGYTGMPVVARDAKDKNRFVSAEIQAKMAFQGQANQRLLWEVPKEYRKEYDFVYDFDQFGEEGQAYIAVVHIDGNGMSKRIQKWAARPENQDNRTYISNMREFSQKIKDSARDTLRLSIQDLTFTTKGKIGGVVEIKNNRLPVRPVVFGGDDTTLICDGRLGLILAQRYLERYSDHKLPDEKYITARAGVAIVKTHFPVARAYALAEELIHSAKKMLRQEKRSERHSALDWHFSTSGPILDLERIRKHEFETPVGSLLMRPVYLEDRSEWRTWQNVASNVKTFLEGEDWKGSQNQVMALRQVLRDGPEAVRQFLVSHPSGKSGLARKLFAIPGYPESADTGWIGKNCTCFDAIEMMDFFVEMKEGR